MRTKRHWEECNRLTSYHVAQTIAQQLKEIAKENGFCPHGVRALTKEQTRNLGFHADSMVRWDEGPENWPEIFQIREFPGVCYESFDEYSISIYDITLPSRG